MKATLNYTRATEDPIRVYEFLNATNLKPSNSFPPNSFNTPDGCERQETICKERVDVAFFLDASSSMSIAEFADVLDVVVGVVTPEKNILSISPGNSRAALVTFDFNATVWQSLTDNFTQFNQSIQDVHDYNSRPRGGQTNITAALESAIEIFQGSDPEALKIVFLITDGVHTTAGADPDLLAERIRSDSRSLLIVVGIGDSQNKEGLRVLASNGSFFGAGAGENASLRALFPEIQPAFCGEYTRPCNGCAGLCLCSNQCEMPPPPLVPTDPPTTVIIPTAVPTTEPPVDVCPPNSIDCCRDDLGNPHLINCTDLHGDIFNATNQQGQPCYDIQCPSPDAVASLYVDPEMTILKIDAECNITQLSPAFECVVVTTPSDNNDGAPVIGIALGVVGAVLVLAAVGFIAFRLFSSPPPPPPAGPVGALLPPGGAVMANPAHAPAAEAHANAAAV